MEEYETVTLILNTLDISTSQRGQSFNNAGTVYTRDTQNGSMSNNKCDLTWKNINLQYVMGDVFDKYDSFNLYLYQINQSSGLGGSSTMSVSNALVDVKIKGLPFLNNSYNTITGINNNEAFLTSYMISTASVTSFGIMTPLYNPSIVTFGKGSTIVDFNITMKKHLTTNIQLLQIIWHWEPLYLCLKYMEYPKEII